MTKIKKLIEKIPLPLYIIPCIFMVMLIKVIVNNCFLLVPIFSALFLSWLVLAFKTKKWNKLISKGNFSELTSFASRNALFSKNKFRYFLRMFIITCTVFLLLSAVIFGITLPQRTLSETAYTVYRELINKGIGRKASYNIIKNIEQTKEINNEDGLRITSRAGARRELLLNSDLPADVKSYIDQNLIQQSDNKKNVDYSQPEMVRAIEKYRDYSEEYDGKTNFEHFSKNLSERQKKTLSVTSESSRGSLARRMALLGDDTLTAEQKNKFDAEFLSEIPEQKFSKELYDEIMSSEPGFTASYEIFEKTYNIMAEQPTRNQALGALVQPPEGSPLKKPLPVDLACKVYAASGLKKAYDYRDEDRFYASLLSTSQRAKCGEVVAKFNLDTVGHYYYFNKVMSAGGSKKKQKIQALMDIGFTKQQAEAYYDAVN